MGKSERRAIAKARKTYNDKIVNQAKYAAKRADKKGRVREK